MLLNNAILMLFCTVSCCFSVLKMLKLGEVATEFVGFGAAKVSLWEEADNSIDQDDIVQGRLGDCYFLSSLSVLGNL